MKWSIFFVNILIHVGVMALFLTIFFFTIAQYFEKQIVQQQINFVIDDFVGNSLKPVTPEMKTKIKNQLNEAFSGLDFEAQDKAVEDQNAEVQKKAWQFVGMLVGIIAVVVIIFGFIYKWEWYYLRFLVNSAVISLIFVAIAETLFMFLIAQNFLSADPNKIKLNIVNTLTDATCNPDPHKRKPHKTPCIGSLQ